MEYYNEGFNEWSEAMASIIDEEDERISKFHYERGIEEYVEELNKGENRYDRHQDNYCKGSS